MGAQVVKTTVSLAALVFFLTYAVLCVRFFTLENAHVSWGYAIAEFTVENRGLADHVIRYRHPERGWVEERAQDIYTDPHLAAIAAENNRRARLFAWYALVPALLAALLAGLWFVYAGKTLEDDHHVRGTHLVSHKDLKAWSERKWKDYRRQFGSSLKRGPQYTIAGIKFPPNAVEAQTAICGTVGTGKSTAIKELLATIRSLDGRAIIYDRTGAFVRDFYDPVRDIIINPFDARSKAWSPFLEAQQASFFTQLAEVLIPDRPGSSDPFWTQSARIVFDYAAQSLWKTATPSNAALRDAILQIPSADLAALIDQTPGRHFFSTEIAKTADSIRANLIAELRFLEFLRDDAEPFSIRRWVKEGGEGFVFLTGDAEHAAATRNITSAIFEVAANALLTCDETNEPRIWFMMDEVPTLNRMPFLAKSLAEIRQFGGAFVVGYQVFSQLEEIYGDKGAKTIAGNLNNRVIFNTPDADTAEIFSKSLGSEDVEEQRQSISVGAHETRDGVGWMTQRTERRIVTASQIQSLPQFQGYIRFAYDAPTAFVVFEPYATVTKAEKFIPYHGRHFAPGQLQGIAGDIAPEAECPEGASSGLNPDVERATFETYRTRLVDGGLALFAEAEQEERLWSHYLRERRAGRKGADIGPPGQSGSWLGSNALVPPVMPLPALAPVGSSEDRPETADAEKRPGQHPRPVSAPDTNTAPAPAVPPASPKPRRFEILEAILTESNAL